VSFKKRVEILIPTHYESILNGGKHEEVNGDEYATTYKELSDNFCGWTHDPTVKNGEWVDEDGNKFSDTHTTLFCDIDYTETNKQFLDKYKEVLKKRFKQKDIYITIHDVEVI
jgi:hypothetical protein